MEIKTTRRIKEKKKKKEQEAYTTLTRLETKQRIGLHHLPSADLGRQWEGSSRLPFPQPLVNVQGPNIPKIHILCFIF